MIVKVWAWLLSISGWQINVRQLLRGVIILSMQMYKIVAVAFLFLFSGIVSADIVEQWQQGLKGAKLTSYSGSVISSNSTLETVSFCSNGQYQYYKEGSWSVPGVAGGASNNTITGRWQVLQNAAGVMLQYVTDQGEQGTFPIYLQANGRVNIGGTAFAVQQGGAGC